MNEKMNDFAEWLHDAKHALEREREEMEEKAEQISYRLNALEVTSELLAELETLKEDNEKLRSLLQEEKDTRAKLEMQMKEMSKLSASVAGKASQEEVLKALRVFVNKSKRKKLDKRIAVKEMVLEMAIANGVTLPEDLAATIECLDDEQPEARVVNVAGNYNDIHDNGSVNKI
ncbi:MAG: hypothetical protein IJR69_01860 [Bacteroidaceae bacterium]|nr:hypothetical protein [Bacteroidaceae bacterium]